MLQSPSSPREFFRVKVGQVALAVSIVVLVGLSIALTLNSIQLNQQTQSLVLSQESDSAAVVFVQRESFGLIVELDRYQMGQSSVEDLIIARSTLSQRLNVIPEGGQSTFELSGEAYQNSLIELDRVLTSIIEGSASFSPSQTSDVADAFLTETRTLTSIFQELSRNSIRETVENRARVDITQGILSVSALFLGIILVLWVVFDISRRFRRTSLALEQQRLRLAKQEQDFEAIVQLDKQIAKWNQEIEESGVTDSMVREIETVLSVASETSSVVNREVRDGNFEYQIQNAATQDGSTILQSRLKDLMQHITSRGEALGQLQYEREHCGLTGLLNRRGLNTKLRNKLAGGSELPLLMVSIDIDGFSAFNNSMGSELGDELLRATAHNLGNLPFSELTIARVASDEFALLLPLRGQDPGLVMDRIVQATNFKTSLQGTSVNVSSCMGWHVVETLESVDEIVSKAAAALRGARLRNLQGSTKEFVVGNDDYLLQEYQDQLNLRKALSNREVVPYFQPIVSLTTGEIQGFESLARWIDPKRGLIMPDEFIPLAASSDLLGVLFESILETAARLWKDEVLSLSNSTREIPYFSVNVDATTVGNSDFVAQVEAILKSVGIPANHLVLELTEQTLGNAVSIERLRTLQSRGIRISLDDFGTGYSNLSRLSTMPLDVVKVDRSFLPDSLEDSKSLELLQTIYELATNASLDIVVEGVETKEMVDLLKNIGFTSGQGYLFDRAFPAGELIAKLTEEETPYL